MGKPAGDLTHPVELEARGAHHDGGVGVVGLERGERLDRLAEPLLIGEEGAALGEQVAHACALEGLELALEGGDIDVGIGGGGERDEPGGAGVLLADELQLHQRFRLDPHFPVGEEAVEFLHAEGIGADRGEVAVLGGVRAGAQLGGAGPAGMWVGGARKGAEGIKSRRVVARGEHECGVLVDRRHFEHRGRGGAAFLQGGHTPSGRCAVGAAQGGLDDAPGVECERHGDPTGGAYGALAQGGR